MENHLLGKIDKNMNTFSKGQKLIAEYIQENYDKAAFMTAAKLGYTVGVSESTVVRFATELGYDGYPRLQQAMQEMIKNRLTSVQRVEVAYSRIGNSDVLDTVMTQDANKIKRTLEETSKEDFYSAVEKIINAEKIYIVAARSSYFLAEFLGFYLKLIFNNVKIINATVEMEVCEQLLNTNNRDVVIGISFPRYSKCAVKAIEFASEKGANIISITDSKNSPMFNVSDCVLLARSDVISVVDSLTAPLSLINSLIVAIALRKKEEVQDIFDRLEKIWDKYGVYEKIEEERE